jgi:O-antigen ligase
MRRLVPAALGALHAAIPIFPAFIALTNVAFPGVSLIGAPLASAVLVLACSIAVYLFAMLLLDRSRVAQPLLWPLAAWVAAALVSALAGFDPRAGLLFVCTFGLGGIVWHCALVRFFSARYVAPVLFWSYLLSGTLAAAAAVAMVLLRAPAALYAISHGRATGTFILPGELAAYLVVFIPIAFAIARVTRTLPLRLLAWVAVAAGTCALYETHSRAGWMGFAAAAAFLAATQISRRRSTLIAAAVAAGGAAAVLLAFNAQHNPSEDYTRIAIWQAAVQIIDRFPLTGVGAFDFSRLYAVLHVPDADATAFHAHSLYLTFFAELGILGLAAFAYNGWVLARVLRARLATAAPEAALLSLAVTAGLVGVAVQGLIDTMSIVIFGLWMPTMGLAVAAAAGRWDSS